MSSEEQTGTVDPKPAAPAGEPVSENPASKPAKVKPTKQLKVKKSPMKRSQGNRPRSYPPYEEMVSDAISTLKERTGSSHYAIAKFIEDKHKQLPSNFKKMLSYSLRRQVDSGKIVKMKNSFKFPPRRSVPSKPASAPAKKSSSTTLKAKPRTTAKPKEAKSVKPAAKKNVVRKAKIVAKPKRKVAVAKPKQVAKSAVSRTRPPIKERPSKVAKTSKESTPGKKATNKPMRAPVAKKAVAKVAKSFGKKGPSRKAKK